MGREVLDFNRSRTSRFVPVFGKSRTSRFVTFRGNRSPGGLRCSGFSGGESGGLRGSLAPGTGFLPWRNLGSPKRDSPVVALGFGGFCKNRLSEGVSGGVKEIWGSERRSRTDEMGVILGRSGVGFLTGSWGPDNFSRRSDESFALREERKCDKGRELPDFNIVGQAGMSYR